MFKSSRLRGPEGCRMVARYTHRLPAPTSLRSTRRYYLDEKSILQVFYGGQDGVYGQLYHDDLEHDALCKVLVLLCVILCSIEDA